MDGIIQHETQIANNPSNCNYKLCAIHIRLDFSLSFSIQLHVFHLFYCNNTMTMFKMVDDYKRKTQTTFLCNWKSRVCGNKSIKANVVHQIEWESDWVWRRRQNKFYQITQYVIRFGDLANQMKTNGCESVSEREKTKNNNI